MLFRVLFKKLFPVSAFQQFSYELFLFILSIYLSCIPMDGAKAINYQLSKTEPQCIAIELYF